MQLYLFTEVAASPDCDFHILIWLDRANAGFGIDGIDIVGFDLRGRGNTLKRKGDYLVLVMVKDWSFSSGEKSREGTETKII